MAHVHIKPFCSGNGGLALVDLDADGVAIAQALQNQPLSAAKLEDAAWAQRCDMPIDEGHLFEIDGPRIIILETLGQLLQLRHGSPELFDTTIGSNDFFPRRKLFPALRWPSNVAIGRRRY